MEAFFKEDQFQFSLAMYLAENEDVRKDFKVNLEFASYKDGETKMIAGNVNDFEFTNKNNVCYLTKNNELYHYDYNNESKKIEKYDNLYEYQMIK